MIACASQDEERVPQLEKDDDEFLRHPGLLVHKLDPPPEPNPSQPLPMLAREAEFCEAMGISQDLSDGNQGLLDQQ